MAAIPDKDAPLSIAFFSPGWPLDAFPNGIVTYVKTISESLRSMGHQVTILAGAVGEGFSDPDVYDLSRSTSRSFARKVVDSLSFRIAPDIAGPYLARRNLAESIGKVVAERAIQILEIEESFGWAEAIRRASPAVVCVRMHGPWFLNGTVLGIAQDAKFHSRVKQEKRGLLAADAISSPAQDVIDRTREYYGIPMASADVIPNPTVPVSPAHRWNSSGADPRLILFIGRFDSHKGGDLIIEGFRHVLREIPDAKLCFIGPDRGCIVDGRTRQLEEFVQEQIPEAIASGQFEWRGHQPHSALSELRRRAAVIVIPSRYDNFPSTAQEAVSSGCPIVAARAGGIPEIIQDGITGRLHRPGDSQDLAEKIVATLKDPQSAAEMGARATADSDQRFHPEVIASRLVETYRKALAQRGR